MRSSLMTALPHAEPGGEADGEDQHDDGHVVGLGDDGLEIGVGHGPAAEAAGTNCKMPQATIGSVKKLRK